MAEFPGAVWADEARRALDELNRGGRPGLFNQAHELFEQEKYLEAAALFLETAGDRRDELAERALYFRAVSLLKAEDFTGSEQAFRELRQIFPDGSLRPKPDCTWD